MTAEAWVEWITRPQGPEVPAEWTLACRHGSVTSEAVKMHYAPDIALGLFVTLRDEHPDLPLNDLAMIAARMLLGQLLAEATGCSCGQRPFAVVHDEDGYWVEDAG
jgi:hypothetical protein